MTRRNFLSGLSVDRQAHVRTDPERLRQLWESPAARVLPVWRSKHIVISSSRAPEIVFLSVQPFVDELECATLLGQADGLAYFALDVSRFEEPHRELALAGEHDIVGLREVAPIISHADGALLAYANGMMSWHRRHLFCGACGAATSVSQAGHQRDCSQCGVVHFPRTDPAVIMLVTRGERCLLGRQASWPDKVYSTLAGFVEPGESLEEAVAREVKEESGIVVEDVRYHSSQPWPFPSSLMLGFTAIAKTERIEPQMDELEDARWVSREEILEGSAVALPSKISIARRLIEDWLESAGRAR